MKVTSCLLVAILLCTTVVPLRAETWSGDKKSSYRQAGTKKWFKARIVASPGVVEVFSVPQGKLVARFDKGNVLVKKGGKVVDSDFELEEKTSWKKGVVAAALMIAGPILILQSRVTKRSVGRPDKHTTEPIRATAGLGSMLVGTGFLAATFTTRRSRYLEISDGLKKIELRVKKKNMNAFRNDIESALGQ